MAPAVACAAGNDCGCKWGEELSGLDKQCMGPRRCAGRPYLCFGLRSVLLPPQPLWDRGRVHDGGRRQGWVLRPLAVAAGVSTAGLYIQVELLRRRLGHRLPLWQKPARLSTRLLEWIAAVPRGRAGELGLAVRPDVCPFRSLVLWRVYGLPAAHTWASRLGRFAARGPLARAARAGRGRHGVRAR